MNWRNSIPTKQSPLSYQLSSIGLAIVSINLKADADTVIQQTKTWVCEVVIGLDLCPFAAREFKHDRIDYIVSDSAETEQHLQQLADCFSTLDEHADIETSLLVFPVAYQQFDDYLDLLHLANLLLADLNYTGVYQLASFHPNYVFAESRASDASNFTNRSPYPMIHVLREISVEKAVYHCPDIDQVPIRNIQKLQGIGHKKLQGTLEDILHDDIPYDDLPRKSNLKESR